MRTREPIPPAQRRRTALQVAVGAPFAGLIWLLIIRLVSGTWSLGFPLTIVGVSCSLALLMLVREPVGSLACRIWTGLIFVIDWVVTRVLCAMLYYLIFTPLGLVLRVLGVPLLKLKADPGASSYWEKGSPRRDDGRHYFRQY